MKESALQKSILDYLAYIPNIYFFRAGSGLIQTQKGNWFRSGKAGCPDICLCVKGKFYGLELKVGKNKLSGLQKQAKQQIEDSGGVYMVVRGMEDLQIIDF